MIEQTNENNTFEVTFFKLARLKFSNNLNAAKLSFQYN